MQLIPFFRNYWKSFLAMGIVFYLSLSTPTTFKDLPLPAFKGIDKIVHFIMYLLLSGTLYFDYKHSTKNYQKKMLHCIIITILFPIILGGVIEILQSKFIIGRSGSLIDWLYDILGTLTGYVLMYLFIKNRRE